MEAQLYSTNKQTNLLIVQAKGDVQKKYTPDLQKKYTNIAPWRQRYPF